MKHSSSFASLVIAPFALCAMHSAFAEDLFVGSYDSETRENFGRDTYGEFKIAISLLEPRKYVATVSRGSRLIGRSELTRCSESDEPYLANRPKGRAEVLCSQPGMAFISFAENGIFVPAVDMEALSKGGASGANPPKFKLVHRKAKYYARVGWGIFGFRKVK